jgi:hypothetical protein
MLNAPEAPLLAVKAPWMYHVYIYSKDDVRAPFVKTPCFHAMESISTIVQFIEWLIVKMRLLFWFRCGYSLV